MAPQTSTLATVIDLLVKKVQGLGLTIGGNPVPVFDGVEGPSDEDTFVVIMADTNDPEAQATMEWAALGSRARYENYNLVIGIFSCMGGQSDDFGPNDAEAGARANAATVQTAIEAALLADINLATQNNGVAPIIWMELQGLDYGQMPPDENSGMGRFAFFRQHIHVYNRLSGG